jgi:feruloyl esterase
MNRQLRRFKVVAGLLLGFAPCTGPGALAAVGCTRSAVQSISPADTKIVSAAPQSEPVPYCDVLGYVTTRHPGPNQVNFKLRLPAKGNGRFLFIGNGGFAGGLEGVADFKDIAHLTEEGFAIAVTDTGHQGFVLDGSWALHDRAKQSDYLFRGVHVTATAGKAITGRFYGQLPRAYFAGCSNGGRQALVEAQRYPSDFDGIIAGAPALGAYIPGFNWNQRHLTANADGYLDSDKLALLDAAVLDSCDALDGVVDTLIQDPRKCDFDQASLLCTGGNDSNCLTAGQVASLTAIYNGAVRTDGQVVYSGFPKSDSAADSSWGIWMTGFFAPDASGHPEPWSDPTLAPLQFIFQDQGFKYFIFGDPEYNFLDFDIENRDDLARFHRVWNRGGGEATNPDLSAFEKQGGKLIIYHGWSDPALSALETIRYYEKVVDHWPGKSAARFARLFMIPGMQHCAGSGPGPNVFDPLASMIDWVENKKAPDKMIASHFQDNDRTGTLTRAMPLCPYPKTAIFKRGDVNDASNWRCHP